MLSRGRAPPGKTSQPPLWSDVSGLDKCCVSARQAFGCGPRETALGLLILRVLLTGLSVFEPVLVRLAGVSGSQRSVASVALRSSTARSSGACILRHLTLPPSTEYASSRIPTHHHRM